MPKLILLLLIALPLVLAQDSGLDAIVALVKAKMSESLILKSIQKEGKSYDLRAADLLKLQQAGATEKIIEALMEPAKAALPAAPAVPVAPAVAPPVAPAEAPAPKKRGFFGSIGDSMKDTAKRTAGSTTDSMKRTTEKSINDAGNSVTKTAEKTEKSIDKGVTTKLETTQAQVDSKVEKATGAVKVLEPATSKVKN